MPDKLHRQARPPAQSCEHNDIVLPAPDAQPSTLSVPSLFNHAPQVVRLRSVASDTQSLANPWLAFSTYLRVAFLELFAVLGIAPFVCRVVWVGGFREVGG